MKAEDHKFFVYKITNIINGKMYFGITKCTLKKRWNEHTHNSLKNKKKTHLCLAIKKYGTESFTMELMKVCKTEKEMYETEINLIKFYRTNEKDFGYNNSTGGETSSKGKKLSLETKNKISAFQKGKRRNPCLEETKRKIGDANRGRKLSLESRNKMGIARRGISAKNKRKIYFIDKNGILNKFNSLTEASRHTGIALSSISQNLTRRTKSSGGLIWHYQ